MPRGLSRRWLWRLAALGAALALAANRGFRRLASGTLAARRFDRRLAALRGEEAELNSRIERLKKSDAALEGSARSELGYLKPGELEYRFPPPGK